MAERAPPILPVDPEQKTRQAADIGRVVEALAGRESPLPAAPLVGLFFAGSSLCSIPESVLDFYGVDLDDVEKTAPTRALHDDKGRRIGSASLTLDDNRVSIALFFDACA